MFLGLVGLVVLVSQVQSITFVVNEMGYLQIIENLTRSA